MNKILNTILYFLLLLVYVVGVAGGVISLLCLKYWPIALCVGFVGYMAYPKAREYFDKMMA